MNTGYIYINQFCSSKNSYGNKTLAAEAAQAGMFCSSKNSYGNKTEL